MVVQWIKIRLIIKGAEIPERISVGSQAGFGVANINYPININ